MARRHWFAVASWASVLVGLSVACGDSVTGIDGPVTAGGDSGSGNDSGSSGDSSSTVPPPQDASVPDTNRPDAANVDGGPPSAGPTTIDFGEVNCGATANPQPLTIHNPSAQTITWSVSLGKGATSPYTIAPASGTAAPGETVTVTVTPKQVPGTSSTAANAFGDTVNVLHGATSTSIALKETAKGAVLFYQPATPIAFGNSPTAAGTVQSNFAVANSGNATANVTLSTTGDAAFAIVPPAAITAVPGLTGAKVSFTPTQNQAYSGAIAMAVANTDVLCAPLPANLAVSGTGTDGILAVTPPQVLFGNAGQTDCGTTAAPQKVKIANSGNAPVNYTAVLQRGTTVFTLSSASGQVQANSSIEITVTPKQIGTSGVSTVTDAFGDTLTITTDALGDSPHTIPLHQTARGVILSRGTGSVGFGNVAVGTSSSQTYSFANTGNVDVTLVMANAFPEFVQMTPVTVSAGGFATPNVTFTPGAVRGYSDIGTLTMNPVMPLCNALPGNLTITGTGTNPSIVPSPTSVPFGFVQCGTVGNAQTLKITNNGPATTLNTSLQKGAGSYFTVNPSTNIPVSAGGFVNLTITPSPIPQTSSVSNNFYGDVLDITSGNGNVSVNLTMTAQGAIITYNGKTSHSFNTSTTRIGMNQSLATNLIVKNDGNLPASLTFSAATTSTIPANPTPPAAFFATTTMSSIAAGTNDPNVAVTFTNPAAANVQYNGTWQASTTTVLCAPLPAPMTLTGFGGP